MVGGRMTVGSAEESKLRVFRNNELIGDGTVAALREGSGVEDVARAMRRCAVCGEDENRNRRHAGFYREDAHERKLVVEGANA